MTTVSVAEAKSHLSEFLNRIQAGEEVIITRRGQPIARLSPIQQPRKPVRSLEAFRRQIKPPKTSASKVLAELRKTAR
jgi:prevent-host-death family protein